MRRSCPLPLLCIGLAALSIAGCDGALSMSQRLVGEWVGRPETAAERIVREWPARAGGKQLTADDPEIAAAIAKAPVTDLETQAAETRVTMRLGELGGATLSLAGEQELTGQWGITPLEGRRAQLEIEIEPATEGEKPVRRRFDLEFFKEGEAFTLREQSADRRFGRLVFRRPGDTGQAAPTVTEPATQPAGDASDE